MFFNVSFQLRSNSFNANYRTNVILSCTCLIYNVLLIAAIIDFHRICEVYPINGRLLAINT